MAAGGVAILKSLRPSRNAVSLPARVAEDIRSFEARSEQLTGWIQLAIGVFILTLFVIAPKPADGDLVSPVPLGLGAYIALTALRLYLSYRIGLPRSFLFVSVLLDIALLYGLIWLFHLQYGQVAGFSLQAPTILYVFIFIALRALRFEPVWVLVTGLTAAGGWVGMTMLAIWYDGTAQITRSFVEYVASTKIMIGAEVDKIVVIVAVAGILAVAIGRAQKLLLKTIREGVERAEIRRFLPAEVEARITSAELAVAAGDAAERHAAVIFLDIRGFTSFVRESDPKSVVQALVRLHAVVVPIVERHGGLVDKYLGDGLLATFGAARESDTAAADALSALCQIIDASQAWTSEIAAESGLALSVNGAAVAGPVVFAALGDTRRLEYTVIGEAVNLAAKLEKHNKQEATRALTTAETLAQASEQGFVPSAHEVVRRERAVAGVDEPLDLAVLA
ncbi:adenylate/guanylate cyclase domain-containing protein [Jiella marina]|uniref:adenylate/guanylate cyclase domain-containing protein n=1 Tax=Jiella sp. LLJ827 TaxID=2917712 RepID=UPI002100F955|nr:adenylate/guanylate cyclase domain-containing protein [Jiella sp. LLJ827]MCQ0986827.1 adenylate/guanylate cyclase domain-containing protein [Jiella sp. LLJ827]